VYGYLHLAEAIYYYYFIFNKEKPFSEKRSIINKKLSDTTKTIDKLKYWINELAETIQWRMVHSDFV